MGLESPSHWLILAVIVLVLFGYKKLPEMSRSVGRSLRIFKTEMKGMTDDDAARDSAEQPAAQSQPSTPVVTAQVPPPVATPGVETPVVAQPAVQAAPPEQPVAHADSAHDTPQQQA